MSPSTESLRERLNANRKATTRMTINRIILNLKIWIIIYILLLLCIRVKRNNNFVNFYVSFF